MYLLGVAFRLSSVHVGREKITNVLFVYVLWKHNEKKLLSSQAYYNEASSYPYSMLELQFQSSSLLLFF